MQFLTQQTISTPPVVWGNSLLELIGSFKYLASLPQQNNLYSLNTRGDPPYATAFRKPCKLNVNACITNKIEGTLGVI